MLETFTRYAEAAGAKVQVAPHPAAVVPLLMAEPPGVLRCSAAVCAAYPDLCAAWRQAGVPLEIVEEIAERAESPSALAATLAGGTGVVLAYAGVAETGSVLLGDDALAPRLLSMLADVCVILLPAAAIVPDLDAAARVLAQLEQAGHRYVSFVTGPSRTADIERVLTIGVQGPRALQVIVLAPREEEGP